MLCHFFVATLGVLIAAYYYTLTSLGSTERFYGVISEVPTLHYNEIKSFAHFEELFGKFNVLHVKGASAATVSGNQTPGAWRAVLAKAFRGALEENDEMAQGKKGFTMNQGKRPFEGENWYGYMMWTQNSKMRSGLLLRKSMPLETPPFFQGERVKHRSGVFNFFAGETDVPAGKRGMLGNKDHVDNLSNSSGVWQYQVRGAKTWWIHPAYFRRRWTGKAPIVNTTSGRLKVFVEQGDFFFINTQMWFHETWIPNTKKAPLETEHLSFSYGRDFLFESDANALSDDEAAEAEAHLSARDRTLQSESARLRRSLSNLRRAWQGYVMVRYANIKSTLRGWFDFGEQGDDF